MKKNIVLSLIAAATGAVSGWAQTAPSTEAANSHEGPGPQVHETTPPERKYMLGDWLGLHTPESPFTFSLGYLQEYLGVINGGLHRRGEYDALASVGLDIDFEKLFGWQGATFHTTGYSIIGRSLSGRDIGDDSGVSNINYRNSVRLFEAWLEQSLFDGKFSIRAGQMAADSDFFSSAVDGSVPGGGLFINSDFGAMPIASFNAPVPIYAIAALGVRVQVKPTDHSYLAVAAYDGNPAPDYLGDPSPGFVAGDQYNDHGVRYNLNSREGAFIISEAGFKINEPTESEPAADGKADPGKSMVDPSNEAQAALAPARGLPGSYKVGGYFHTDRFTRWSDGTAIRGIWALYAIGAQKIWNENASGDDQGLYLFTRLSTAPKNRATLDWAIDGGINYVGAIPGRDGDILGVGCSCKHYSPTLSDALESAGEEGVDTESILELTYQVNLTPYLSVQPDFQYVFQPGGHASASDAAVLGVRVNTLF